MLGTTEKIYASLGFNVNANDPDQLADFMLCPNCHQLISLFI